MKLNNTLEFAVRFANTAANMGIKPYDLASLCKWADERASYYTLWNNAGCKHVERYQRYEKGAMEKTVSLAQNYGYDVEYNWLYPTFTRRSDKREFHLPD